MPTAAVSTMLKWIGWMPICLAIGKTTGTSTTAAGRPSSTMPKRITIIDTASMNSHGVPCSGCSRLPSIAGTPSMPIRNW